MSVAGLTILILGKLYLSSELRLSGWRARIAGLLLLLPLPAITVIGLITGVLIGSGILPQSATIFVSALEYILFFSMPVAVALMAILNKPRAAATATGKTADVQAHLTEGKHWLELGYDGLAVNACEAAIQTNPRSLEAYELLAEIHRRRADWEASARALQSALELDPRRACNHYRISLCYKNLGRSEQAERERKITMQLDPAFSTSAEDARMVFSPTQIQDTQGDNE